MATVKDKASAGCDHLRYMLSSWFESSQDETDPGSNSASMVGQAKPETQEQIRSFVLEVLFCAWKMHALGPGVRGNRNRAGSNPGWARHGVTPVLSAPAGGGARSSGSNGDVLVPRGASLAGVQPAHQLGSRYLRVQTTPPDHVQFGRRSPSPAAAPSPPPQLLPPPGPRAPPPPLMACSAPRRAQRSSRCVRSHRNKKRSNISNAGKKSTHRPNSSPAAGCSLSSRRTSPELPRRVLSPQRCQSAANNRQVFSGREQDTAGRKALLGAGWGGWAGLHRPESERGHFSEKHRDTASRKALLGSGWQGRGGRHRPVAEWNRVERREKRTNFSVVLCGGAGLGSRRARRERPTKPVEVLRRVTACLERYSHLEARQRRAVTLCRAAQLAKTRPSSSSEVVTTASTKVSKPGGGVVGHRSGRPALARSANGTKGLCQGVNGNDNERPAGRCVNGNEGLRLDVNGNEVGGGVNSSEGLGGDANGNIGRLLLGRYVNGNGGLGRCVNGNEGLDWYVNGNEGLGRGVNGYTGRLLGRRNVDGGRDGGADVVDNVRSEMLGRGPSLGKESEREDRWI